LNSLSVSAVSGTQDRDDVGTRQERQQVLGLADVLDVVRSRRVRATRRDHVHAETVRALRDLTADAAMPTTRSSDPAATTGRIPEPSRSKTGRLIREMRAHVARQREQHRERVIGDRGPAHAARVGEHDRIVGKRAARCCT